jgi:two-component system, cell cycle sensor histidine kinase and response regulator CckA
VSRILVVDDCLENRYLLESILHGHGHETASAENGAEALDLADAQDFDLILSDILMPVMDGFALCRAWKQDPRLSGIPFVIYTATYTEPSDEQFALSLGADRFLVKPLPPEEILREIKDLLGRELNPAPKGRVQEADFIHQHNQALFRKLEKKQEDNKRLEARNARFGKILDASLNEIFIFDGATLRFTWVNQGALEHLGFPEAELRRLTLLDLGPGLGPEGLDAMLAPLRDGSRSMQVFELALRAKDGSSYPVEVHLEPILDGTELSFLAVVQDITERRRQEQEHRRREGELQHAQKLESLGRMAGGVAHDLNNLLAPILGLAGILQERYGEDPLLSKKLGTILLAAERGRDLVRGLTDFARKDIFAVVEVDLNALVLQAVDLVKADCGPEVRWVLEVPEEPARVQGDPSALSRVLLNLIHNAVDAMSPQGTVGLRISRPTDRQVLISVQDTGRGIPQELLSQVMEPFFTTKARGKGTGLGLAIANGIVHSHSGTLTIQSQEGQGTTVQVLLPAR